MSAARTAAYHVLQAVADGDDLPAALARHRDSLTDPRDRALVTELASGTLRWQGALDCLIEHAAGRPTAKLDQAVLAVLRLGTYQLRYLQRIPASAATNDAVNLVRRLGKSSASGLVNAVLRRMTSKPMASVLPGHPDEPNGLDDQLNFLSVTCSHPRWLVERWLRRVGLHDAITWVQFNNSPAPLTLRTNRIRITRDELARQLAACDVRTEPTLRAREGLTVVSGQPFRTACAKRGLFQAQDEASQLVAELVAAQPRTRLLDACAAPGGKTVALASVHPSEGTHVASDYRPSRIRRLRRALTAAGASSRVQVVQLDLRHPPPFSPVFDCVLVDAPCSGLGVLQTDPEIRWRRTETDLSRLAREQLLLVSQASAVVRPGGRLVYATCSSEPEENEDVVTTFLASHPDFILVPPENLGRLSPGLRETVDPNGQLHTSPPAHGLQAFFAAVIERTTSRL